MKKLLPILLAGILWGKSWHSHRVLCLCDNQAVVACIHSRSSRHKGLMHLLQNCEAYLPWLSPRALLHRHAC